MLCGSKQINNQIEVNTETIIKILKERRNQEIEFILFGEAFLNGFDSLTWDYKKDLEFRDRTKESIKILKQKAKQYNQALGFGYFEFDNKHIYSSYLIIDSKGEQLYNYRRVSMGWRIPDANTNHYKQGLNSGVFTYKNKKIGIALCGDLWDDNLLNIYQNLELDVLLWPVYVDYSLSAWKQEARDEYLLRTKSLAKNVVFINSLSKTAFGGTFFLCNDKLVAETKINDNHGFLICDLRFAYL